jgi:single-strand selective monofunctional uracil DNA glycosylase
MSLEKMVGASARLRDDMDIFADHLVSEGIVDCVYNPLVYAWDIHRAYLEKSVEGGAKAVLLGMNPGPHGMGQMGIPFAATSVVRDLLEIRGIPVLQPKIVHPKRPVMGLDWPKEEVSGTRLWGALSDHYGQIQEIFARVFLVNHCPLMLLSGERGTNITPDKIGGPVVRSMLKRCDEYLREVVEIMGARVVIGVGKYAEKRAISTYLGDRVTVTSCWHPSPASPLANRNGGADWRANFQSVLPS